MIYTICLYLMIIGLTGIVTQLFMGIGHGGHAGGHTGHGTHGGHHGQGHSQHEAREGVNLLLALFSPLMIFTVCLGAGAAGLLLKSLHLPVIEVAEAAALSGIGLYAAVVRPFWRLLFRFASKPSEGLEGAVGSDAIAVTKFDASGRGLVKLTIDGQQVSNMLAILDDPARDNSPAIQPGAVLTVTSVNAHDNTCCVAKL